MISKAERRKAIERWQPKPSKGHSGSRIESSEFEPSWDFLDINVTSEFEPRIEIEQPKSEIMEAIEYLGLDPKIRYGLGKQQRKAIIAEYREKKELQDNFGAALAAL